MCIISNANPYKIFVLCTIRYSKYYLDVKPTISHTNCCSIGVANGELRGEVVQNTAKVFMLEWLKTGLLQHHQLAAALCFESINVEIRSSIQSFRTDFSSVQKKRRKSIETPCFGERIRALAKSVRKSGDVWRWRWMDEGGFQRRKKGRKSAQTCCKRSRQQRKASDIVLDATKRSWTGEKKCWGNKNVLQI